MKVNDNSQWPEIGVYYDLPEATYRDKSHLLLSQSTAKRLLSTSPAHVLAERDAPEEPSKDKDRGTIIHQMLLVGDTKIQVMELEDFPGKKGPAKTFGTEAAREFKRQSREDGFLPIEGPEYREYKKAADAIAKTVELHGLDLSVGHKEVSAVWRSDGVLCKGRFDHLDGLVITDPKTVGRTASPAALPAFVINSGYDIQAAAYVEALEELTGKHGKCAFQWIFAEIEGPHYGVTIARASEGMLELGGRKWGQALSLWRECCEAGVWPSYPCGYNLEPPDWAWRTVEEVT